MRIDKSKIKIIFEFSPEEYYLCKIDEERHGWPYSLNYRIDRSEKGKEDDVGMPRIYLSENEAELAFKEGFSKLVT